MKRIRTYIAALMMAGLSAFALLPAVTVGAAGALDGVCANNGNTGVCEENEKSENANANSLVNDIVNVLLYIVGALSVVMIIIGGLFYVTANGDSGNITKAKNTIMYSIIGLVVAFLAYAIVNWVVDKF